MAVEWLRKLLNQRKKTVRPRGGKSPWFQKLHRYMELETLEKRLMPATYRWLGATSSNWADNTNWFDSYYAGPGPVGDYPQVDSDIVRFTGTPASTTATVNAAGITVGEIDFDTASNITINSSGG